MDLLKDLPKKPLEIDRVDIEFSPDAEDDYTIEETEDGYVIYGKGVEWISRFDIRNYEAMQYIETRLEHMGIMDRLRELGVEDGDLIRIGELEIEYLS